MRSHIHTHARRLKFKVNMYKMDEEREIKPKTLSALVSNMMYEKRYVFMSASVYWSCLQRLGTTATDASYGTTVALVRTLSSP